MARNRFDQASRYAAKLDAIGFLRWLLTDPGVAFLRWLDTHTLPFPGDPERTCDTVACLGDGDDADPWAVPVEFCLKPDGTMFGRLLVYLGQLWLEIRPNGRGTRYCVGAIVVNLTGRGHTSRDLRLGQTGVHMCLEVVEVNPATHDAAPTLEAIASGTLPRCVLPWIPLMLGGDETGIVNQWKEIAAGERNAKRRGDYGGLAVVFAEAAGRLPLWKQGLKGWNMRDSQQVLEWIEQGRKEVLEELRVRDSRQALEWIEQGRAEGKQEGKKEGKKEGKIEGERNALLRLLRKKFSARLPAELVTRIQTCDDEPRLARWFDSAVEAETLQTFRQAMTL